MNEIKNNQKNNPICKYCGSTHTRKYGLYKGVQRYFCNDCGSKFKNDDTTFHMKTDANLVSSAVSMYFEGTPIRGIRRILLPKVGDLWVADETVLDIDGQQLWLWDLIDDKTRMLLSTRLSRSRTTRDAQMLMDKAVKTAGKSPKIIITDKLKSYLDVRYDKDTEHRQGGIARVEDNTQKIERFHQTLKQRTKVMKGLKNFETALDFTEGWLVHYNYLRPHESLQNKTPAEVAGIEYPYKNWADIIRKHKPTSKIVIEHQPRTGIRLLETHIGRPRKRVRISKKLPRLTSPPPRITPPIMRITPKIEKLS
jgi:putative transposase